jgi:GTP-binding protein EngB required for normal cell division
MSDSVAPLTTLIELAREAGAVTIAEEASALRERLAEGRFFVACVGQFKRGKSSLLNALVGDAALPVGVIPVTAVVTVLRYGDTRRAVVRFSSGAAPDGRSTSSTSYDVEPSALAAYVTESENPGNVKGVAGVEVFTPSPLLKGGLCLVDTPGLGSVFEANAEATRAFVPHIDAALVVIGADPPISGEEVALVEEVAKETDRFIFALNKADRLTEEERSHGVAFAAKLLRERLGRSVEPIFEVSALERTKLGITRDFSRLEDRLRALAEEGATILRNAAMRGVRRLSVRLKREIDEQIGALVRPREASEQRIEQLRQAVAGAERGLDEMEHLFAAVQDRLAREFEHQTEEFMKEAPSRARQTLDVALADAAKRERPNLAELAFEIAQDVAEREIESWRKAMAPAAEALYEEAVRRFADLGTELLKRVADPSEPALAALPGSFEADLKFRTQPRFFFAFKMTIAAPRVATRLASRFGSEEQRLRAAAEGASEYLRKLLEINSARVANDLVDQVLESRRRLQSDLRAHLRSVITTAEAALARVQSRREAAHGSEEAERARLETVRSRVSALGNGL